MYSLLKNMYMITSKYPISLGFGCMPANVKNLTDTLSSEIIQMLLLLF